MNNIGGLIFSKDRTMQLRATLESLFLHCKDCDKISLTVLYKVSNLLYRQQYDDLKNRFGNVTFIEEQDFKQQTLGVIGTFEYILFLVDDNLFVRDFCLADVVRTLRYNHDAIGFSLRLGRNTDYCYMLSSQQALPKFRQAGSGILKYYWPGQQYDFGYPLEVSSSVYRVRDILELLVQLEFSNPNTLEGQMAANSQLYSQARSSLLCYECSVTFCNPVNVVQHVYDQNRAGANPNYTSERLAQLYRQGLAIDVTRYDGFVSNGVHQEVQLYFGKKGGDEIRISVVIPCYNQAHYLPEAVESIVNQTYTNWQCIIVNDGSSDNTGEVAGELIKKYSNHDIRLIEKPNGGVADARNTGIDAAESDWVLLLDSDDMFERTFMQKAVDIIRREPKTDIVFANLQQFGADSGEWIPDEYSRETIPVKNTIPYASLYRKELWHKVGGYDRVLGKVLQLEDWTFWISCSQYNPVVRRIPEKLLLYRVHSSNIYYQLIKPNWRVAEALIVTAYPNLYSPPAVVRAWKLIANCPEQIYQRILRTIEMYPECGLPYLWRGLRYQQQGRIDEAIRDYQAAVQKAGEDDWQCFVCLACLQKRVGDMPGARDNIEKVLTIRGDFNWARDMLPDVARQSNSTESQTGRQKILFYFDRIGNLKETSPAGTVIAILNFARALQSSNPDVEIHITGDLVHYPEQYESFRVIPLSPPEQREQFLVDYDVVFFATHIRYFKGLTKPSGQIWVLWQHCWEADDRVSLSHSSDFDIVICLSELHRASLRGQHIGDEKLITIPNLIDTDVYSPRHIRRNNHSIMFAGGLNPHKCVHILLDAFRLVRQQVEDAELHIYGDGQMWRGGDDYGNYLKSIKPQGAYFHGYVDSKDMP
ncbi:MAG: glycosyltransferase, partial [Desulfobacteraceae bacterium]|nr:glycosyltransferase [Desulfobacteraceae bacterium]